MRKTRKARTTKTSKKKERIKNKKCRASHSSRENAGSHNRPHTQQQFQWRRDIHIYIERVSSHTMGTAAQRGNERENVGARPAGMSTCRSHRIASRHYICAWVRAKYTHTYTQALYNTRVCSPLVLSDTPTARSRLYIRHVYICTLYLLALTL